MLGRFDGNWAERLKHLRKGHLLRPGPHTRIGLAETLAMKHKGKAEARRLVEEALRLYPDHPYVLSNAGDVIIQVGYSLKSTGALLIILSFRSPEKTPYLRQ